MASLAGYALFKVADDAKLAQIAEQAEAGDFSTVASDNLLMLKVRIVREKRVTLQVPRGRS